MNDNDDDDVRNIFNQYITTNIYCSCIREMVKILPLGEMTGGHGPTIFPQAIVDPQPLVTLG